MIRSASGVGTGFHFLNAALDNHGLVDVNRPFKLETVGDELPERDDHRRRKLGRSSVSFADDGTTAPGASPGLLTYTGNERQHDLGLNGRSVDSSPARSTIVSR